MLILGSGEDEGKRGCLDRPTGTWNENPLRSLKTQNNNTFVPILTVLPRAPRQPTTSATAFVKGDKKDRFKNLVTENVRGQPPRLFLLDENGSEIEELNVESWDTDVRAHGVDL